MKGVGRLQPCMLVGGGGSSPQLKRFDRCAMAASRSTSSQSLACPSAPCFAVLLPVLRPARLRLLHCASRCSRLRGCCSLCCSLCCRDCDDDGAGGRLSRPEHAAAASKCSCSAPLTCSAPTICSAPPTLKGAADKVPIVYSWRAVFTQAQKTGQMHGQVAAWALPAPNTDTPPTRLGRPPLSGALTATAAWLGPPVSGGGGVATARHPTWPTSRSRSGKEVVNARSSGALP